jgi:hypothetical protein
MPNIFPIDFEEKLTMAQDDYILFSDSEDWNKIKKAQYKNLKWEKWDTWATGWTWPAWARINSASFSGDDIVFGETDWNTVTLAWAKTTLTWPQWNPWTPWADGNDWAAATITVWSVTTWAAWSSATVVNSWTSSAAVLDFTIPQWVAWVPWADWNDWVAATITVWTTTTLPAWSSATVTNVWTSQDAILNFWIPKGDSWSWSGDVSWPASSTDWDVVIFDWSTGKLIKDWSVALSTLSSWASLAATAIQPWDDISDLNNDVWYITSAPVSSVNSQTWAVVLDADDISDSSTTNKFVTQTDKDSWDWKQDKLVSWTNIKTVNWNSILGDGNLTISWLPAWWTNWQIIMMVNGVATWVNPADVWFRLQASDTEIDVPYVWSGTEAQYSARQSYSDDTEYHTV